MNGMIFRSFQKRNHSQKNTNTVYSEYSYPGIVPKERALNSTQILHQHKHSWQVGQPLQNSNIDVDGDGNREIAVWRRKTILF